MFSSSDRPPFFIGLLLVGSAGFLMLSLVFWQAIFWAVVFGVLFRPVELRLSKKLKQRQTLASVLTVVLIFFTVLLPAMTVASAVIAEASGFYARVQSGELDIGALTHRFDSRLPY